MTNELEKTFFDTFGIETYDRYLNCTENLEIDCNRNCNCCDKAEDVYCYPEITDRRLLGLICIATDEEPNIEWLKQCVLENLIHRFEKNLFFNKEQALKQVRTLFEEG